MRQARMLYKKDKNYHIVAILRNMLFATNYQSQSSVMRKFTNEYYNVNNKIQSNSVALICDAFDYLMDENKIINMLKESFYRNCRLTNTVLLTVIKKYNVLNVKQHVLLRVHLVNDCQICVDCYKSLNGDDATPDIISECLVCPENAYLFSCSYICDLCFTNKLYTKI